MSGHDDDPRSFDRRRALQLLGAGLGAASGVLALTAPTAHAAVDCKKTAPIDAAAVQLRRILQYQEKSKVPGKRCSNCAQFEPAKYKECGGCKLFGGAVNPDGHCLSWAAKKA